MTSADTCGNDCFVLTSMTIQGVSAYPLADLAGTYDQNLARKIGVADLVATADAITTRYRQDGYFLTRAVVAPGDHSTGAAYIVVYEGYLVDIQVTGAAAEKVWPILEPLKDGRALTVAMLDHRLALASDIPGVTLTSRIEPVPDNPSQHRLVVTADLKRIEGGVYVDNRGSEAQGPWQAYVTASVNSAVVPGDQITVSALTVPEDPQELSYGEVSYSALIAEETRLKASVSTYATDAPAGSVGWLSGHSQAASIAVTQMLVRSRERSLWASASLDVRKVEQTYQLLGGIEERLTVARAMLSGRLKLDAGYVAGSLQVSQGLDVFDATRTPSPDLTRSDATGEFTKATFNVSAYRDIGRYMGVYGEAAGQWASDPVLASEEFYVGGPGFGRAYDYGEISGDTGMAASVELRAGWDPQPRAITFAQGYAFVDVGWVSNETSSGRIDADRVSAGFGTRITFEDRVTFKVELAKPLTGSPDAEPASGWRAFFGVSREF
ncbi:ShlB/FhaC/HecB family hemolysin secretion/activation protein [Brevundimonas subvibrioides]|uniref:ShlB/FhaC/HecB family hemolysin secretion/activation protein n=1 Tax=Brevundimonas subvibrioides TaxID=74313 RepID=UPI0022B4E542|nr:ShlB/FhaC/HecB family hemolysin secretion/activation protein [Brevundimonas subvibrioides]